MDGGYVEEQSAEEKTYTDVFNEVCPYYLSIGMTYEQFWYGNPDMVIFYKDAHIMRNKSRNQELWLQGRYFIDAIGACLDKKYKYPEQPYDIYPKTRAELEEEAEKQRHKVIEYFNQIKQRWDNGTDRQLNP